ncbi:O-methyltransferase [Streptomyces mirabilis]|uniref:O-methyltransferase n=1 Tax=Streptomyces mirabilis TaxID=68239 RepID=UPI003642753A
MEFDQARAVVDELPGPHIRAHRGRMLYDHIRQWRPTRVLELGTARGGSAVFIAAALRANGAGRLTSVDSCRREWKEPSAQETLERAGLTDLVVLDRSFSTYTWFLKVQLERSLNNGGDLASAYDLIFLDGAKEWSVDGLAVVLAERLLAPGGWLVMDDLGWNYEEHSYGPRHYEVEISGLSETERRTPHLRAVFDLLVKTNPAFTRVIDEDGWWGWAQKKEAS